MRGGRRAVLLACLLVLWGGTALAEGPLVEIQKAGLGPGLPYELSWGPDPAFPGYLVYDVITGDLPTLRAAGDFTVAVAACLAEDIAVPPPALALVAPPLGGQSFYLVRAQALPAVCGAGSWNEGSQVGNRDAEIQSGASCPCP